MQMPSKTDFPIFAEIARERDRGAALIAAGFLDIKLKEAVNACFRDDKDTVRKLTKSTGALGPFGIRIDLAYLLKLYRKETRDDLILIATIRNAFAHQPDPIDFGTKEICENCEKLTLMKRVWGMIPNYPFNERPFKQATARHEYLESVSLAINFLDHQAKHEEFRARAEELLPF